MKKFLIVSFSLLLIALLLVVAVFVYLSIQLKSTTPTSPDVSEETTDVPTAEQTSGIPLRDVPISDSQQKVLETVGVDVDTFVISPAMLDCAEKKLGSERAANIIAGDAPTALETAKLVPCLNAN